MALALRTEIEIAATAERVWDVLTDFAAFPRWNPFIRRIDGVLAPRARLEVQMKPPGGRATTFRPTVLRVEPPRLLSWRGRTLVPGLFDVSTSSRSSLSSTIAFASSTAKTSAGCSCRCSRAR